METTEKFIISKKQPKDISGCQPGTREHIAHEPVEFTNDLFELVPAFEFTKGTLLDLRKEALASGRVPANATDLDFLLENQDNEMVSALLETWKNKRVVFVGTTYRSIQYSCSGEVRILVWLGDQYGWSGDIPNCMDGDNVLDNFYVAFLKK